MVTINPADCPPDLVYMGIVNGRREVMCRFPHRELPWETFANVHADDSVSDLVPLVEARPVARDDLAIENRVAAMLSETVEASWHKRAALILDAVVEHLNGRGGLGIDTREPLERALRDREAAVARAERAEARVRQIESRPWTIALDDKASPVMLPAVTRDEVTSALRAVDRAAEKVGDTSKYGDLADAVLALVSGSDRAVHVVRESDIVAVKVERVPRPNGSHRWDSCDGSGSAVPDGDGAADNARKMVDLRAKGLVSALAVRRAIEAEQAVDPVEAKAKELYGAYHGQHPAVPWPSLNSVGREKFTRLARHVLGQEAGDE